MNTGMARDFHYSPVREDSCRYLCTRGTCTSNTQAVCGSSICHHTQLLILLTSDYFFLLTSDCFSFITSVAKFHHSIIAFFCQLFLLNTYENKFMCLSFCTCMCGACIWNNKAAAYLSNICRDSNKSQ